MKNGFLANLAMLILMLVGAFSISGRAQTTDAGSGASEQPNAPMEIGVPHPQRPPQPRQPPQMGEEAGRPSGADPAKDDPARDDPAKSERGVGRISMIHGDVSIQRGGSSTWSAAVLNQPVLNGNKVSTGKDSRAEVQLDHANILRLGPNAQATMADFTREYIQIKVGQGMASYSVFEEGEAEPEIDTPNVALHPVREDGVFRIEVRPDGDSIIIARKGEAEISTPQGIAQLNPGEMATVRGPGADAKYKINPAPDRDDWDRWNSDRNRMIHESDADAWRHTNRRQVGAGDLNAYGQSQNAPESGQVWLPNQPDGWSPDQDGTWGYAPYWGWAGVGWTWGGGTWVGYAPWGWAPYPYGRGIWYGGARPRSSGRYGGSHGSSAGGSHSSPSGGSHSSGGNSGGEGHR